MEIIIRGDKLKVTQAISDYINDKMSRLEKYIDDYDNVRANVVIKVKNHSQKVEVTIPLKKFILRAEESQEDVYAAVDVIVDKIERQIRKNKTKLQSKKIKGTKDIVIDSIADYDEEETKIVKRKNLDIKPMDEDEAIMQMELLNHDFFAFKNINEECVSVLYKRKDGLYGILNVK